MKINSREWPPDPAKQPRKPRKPTPPDAYLFMLLVLGSPIAAWLAASLGYSWAKAVWPAGWLGALFVAMFSALTHQRDRNK